MDAGRIETDADRLIAAVERAIVERRRHDVVHRVARRRAGNERADQEPRDRRIAVGEMIDVGLLPRRVGAARELQAGEARIAEIARLGRRHRVAAEPEEAERTALKAVRRLLAAAADLRQIVAIAGALQNVALFRRATCPPADRSGAAVERDDLRLARLRDRKARHEFGQRLGVAAARLPSSLPGIAGHQHVAAEGLAVEEHAARQPERRIEIALEGGLEPA